MTYTKLYNVSDLVDMGVDIAGKFMNELVAQAGNIASLVILGLIITVRAAQNCATRTMKILVGLIAAIGTIFRAVPRAISTCSCNMSSRSSRTLKHAPSRALYLVDRTKPEEGRALFPNIFISFGYEPCIC